MNDREHDVGLPHEPNRGSQIADTGDRVAAGCRPTAVRMEGQAVDAVPAALECRADGIR